MPINVGRPPINPAYKVRQIPNRDKSAMVFDAMWEKTTAAPNSWVNIIVTAKVKMENKMLNINVYQVVNHQRHEIETFNIPLNNGRAAKLWMAKPVKSGNYEEGEYHFEASAGNYWGETQKPLLLRDLSTQRHSSVFVNAANSPKVVF